MDRPVQHPVRWLYAFCDQPVFEQADVVSLTGISKASLQNWTNRHILKALNNNPGRQGRRQYSSVSVTALFLAEQLVSSGVAPAGAMITAHEIITKMAAPLFNITLAGGAANLDDIRHAACLIHRREVDEIEIVDRRKDDAARRAFQEGICTIFDFGPRLMSFLKAAQDAHFRGVEWESPAGAQLLGLVEIGRDLGNSFTRYSRLVQINLDDASSADLSGQ